MLSLTGLQQAALAQRRIKRRVFIYCEAKDPITGLPAPAGFWDDVGVVDLSGKTYYGSGNIVSVSTMSGRGDLTIPGLTITVSGIAPEAAVLVRGESIGQAPITVSLGLFDVETHTIIPPLLPFFVGRVDDVEIETPEKGGVSNIRLICESTSRALTIQRTDTRSEASCKAVHPNDGFYNYTGAQREKPLYFGREAP